MLSPAPPKFFVYGTKTCNRAGKDCVLSRSLSGPPSVRAVAGLLGLGCWGRRASQNHPGENTCLTALASPDNASSSSAAGSSSDLPAHHPLSGAACWQVSPLLLPLLCASTLPAGPGCPPPLRRPQGTQLAWVHTAGSSRPTSHAKCCARGAGKGTYCENLRSTVPCSRCPSCRRTMPAPHRQDRGPKPRPRGWPTAPRHRSSLGEHGRILAPLCLCREAWSGCDPPAAHRQVRPGRRPESGWPV